MLTQTSHAYTSLILVQTPYTTHSPPTHAHTQTHSHKFARAHTHTLHTDTHRQLYIPHTQLQIPHTHIHTHIYTYPHSHETHHMHHTRDTQTSNRHTIHTDTHTLTHRHTIYKDILTYGTWTHALTCIHTLTDRHTYLQTLSHTTFTQRQTLGSGNRHFSDSEGTHSTYSRRVGDALQSRLLIESEGSIILQGILPCGV